MFFDISLNLDPQSLQAANSDDWLTQLTLSTTHVDAPRLFFPNAPSIDQLNLEQLQGPAKVIVIPQSAHHVTVHHLVKCSITPGSRILLKTRNSRLLEEDTHHSDYTFLTPQAAQYLADRQLTLFGFDYYSVDSPDAKWQAHITLLQNHIPILEAIYLDPVPPGDYHISCLPLNITHAGASPARAILTKI